MKSTVKNLKEKLDRLADIIYKYVERKIIMLENIKDAREGVSEEGFKDIKESDELEISSISAHIDYSEETSEELKEFENKMTFKELRDKELLRFESEMNRWRPTLDEYEITRWSSTRDERKIADDVERQMKEFAIDEVVEFNKNIRESIKETFGEIRCEKNDV